MSPTTCQGPALTLLCILDCAAHLLPAPEEVVTMFLNQTIKVFTKVKDSSVYPEHTNVWKLKCLSLPHRLNLPQTRLSLCTEH